VCVLTSRCRVDRDTGARSDANFMKIQTNPFLHIINTAMDADVEWEEPALATSQLIHPDGEGTYSGYCLYINDLRREHRALPTTRTCTHGANRRESASETPEAGAYMLEGTTHIPWAQSKGTIAQLQNRLKGQGRDPIAKVMSEARRKGKGLQGQEQCGSRR
jgi:hypothetical protein